MMYQMEYIHDGNLGSHKNGRRVIMNEDIESAHPMDKKGKQYVLPNIEYQQVRKWVLTILENAVGRKSKRSHVGSIQASGFEANESSNGMYNLVYGNAVLGVGPYHIAVKLLILKKCQPTGRASLQKQLC
ncbi:hypothetical protein IFM89_032241 [Coptis chinensis]|uniref:Uncharacterized protein n=1 Tax=Coptis chinensis TaxID=261450 RepID=A0A835HW01_9MAGN|nr:hypothetical protein IFM89_032241 [Coptis chinensis]